MSKLPPGQIETAKFSIVGERRPGSPLSLEDWRLQIEGEVTYPLELTFPDVLALPQRDLTMDVHCVTGWTRPATRFTGVQLIDLFKMVRPRASARFVQFVAYSSREHDTSLPMEVAVRHAWLAHSVDGQRLRVAQGAPLRLVTENRYFYKSLKWIHRIVLLKEDSPGYWERESGYHNNADPWKEERYDPSRIATEEQTARFRESEDFDTYRGNRPESVLIKANLANWSPKTKDLQGLQLKACSFDGADLRNVDFSGANLTLSSFFRADLSHANFTGADLEGVSFVGATLTGAKLIDVSLAAARFFLPRSDGTLVGPKQMAGMIVRGARGLLPEQAAFLRQHDVALE